MSSRSPLWSRVFLATALLAMLGVGIALSLVNRRITADVEHAIEHDITTAAAEADELRAERARGFALMTRFLADLPRLKTGIEANDPTIVKDLLGGYQAQMHAGFVLVTNKAGDLVYASGGSPRVASIAAHQPAVRDALAGRDSVSLLPQPTGILQVVTVPVAGDRPRHETVGTLSTGFLLDEALAGDVKRITGSDVAFGMDGQILAATLPRDQFADLASKLRTTGVSRLTIDGTEFVTLPRRLSISKDPEPATSGPVALFLRSRTDRRRSLEASQTGLAATGIAALLATGLSVVRAFR
jgi:hypothetical protein